MSSAVICLKGCSCLAVFLCSRGTSVLPEGERLYRCSYDFLARNHTELSVLQGETLEVQQKWSILWSRHTAATDVIPASSPLQVLESSDRWSKCRNRFEEIGCVPSNILEPLSALSTAESSVVYREVPTRLTASRPCMHSGFWLTPPCLSCQQRTSNPPRARFFSYAPSSPIGTSSPPISPARPQSMVLPSTLQGEDGDRGNRPLQLCNSESLLSFAVFCVSYMQQLGQQCLSADGSHFLCSGLPRAKPCWYWKNMLTLIYQLPVLCKYYQAAWTKVSCQCRWHSAVIYETTGNRAILNSSRRDLLYFFL